MGIRVPNLDSIIIAGNEFNGIGYQGLLTVNTKTYAESPGRTIDGSMPNINDHDSFIVPRCKINFKYLKIEDYQRLCRILNSANEFPVTYYDKESGEFVTHMMYVEPEEMKKIFNVGTYVFGVLDYDVSFIGTLNQRDALSVTYKADGASSNLAVVTTTEKGNQLYWGDSIKVMTTAEAIEKGVTIPTGKQLVWQLGNETQVNDKGWKVYPNSKCSVFENMVLWATFE